MAIWSALCANKAEDNRNSEAEKQAVETAISRKWHIPDRDEKGGLRRPFEGSSAPADHSLLVWSDIFA